MRPTMLAFPLLVLLGPPSIAQSFGQPPRPEPGLALRPAPGRNALCRRLLERPRRGRPQLAQRPSGLRSCHRHRRPEHPQTATPRAKLTAYASTLPPEIRGKRFPALFAALVDQTNDQRTPLIQRLEQLGRRQRGMGDTIAAVSNKIDAMPATDPHRDDLVGERDFDVRAFQQTQHSMRYACEAPPAMERRLGTFARTLQAQSASK